MADYTETELKLQVTAPGIWDELLVSPLLAADDAEPAVTRSLEARYYDTANQALQQSRLTYRVRREGDRWVATVKGDGKSAGGLHCRQEWNVAVEDDAPDIEPFMATPVGFRLRQAVGGAELLPLFITRFQRRIFNISTADGNRIEAAADRGEIVAGETDRREPILEVELELKQGQPVVLLQLGAELSRRFPLLPEPRSKYYRGLVLAGLTRREDGKSHPPVRLADSDPLGSCLERIMPEWVQQVLAVQTEFLRRPKEPEALHELQTALRRLCSLLAFIQPLLPPKEYIRHKAALQQWDRELEPLRKIEELWTEWRSICRQTGNELEQVLALEHHRQAERLAASLAAGRTTPLLLELWGWLLKLPWKNSLPSEVSLDTFVRQRLPQWLE